VPIRSGIHIGGSNFFRVSNYNPDPEPMAALDGILALSVKEALYQSVWYARTAEAKATSKQSCFVGGL
jgi:hypothetical protein